MKKPKRDMYVVGYKSYLTDKIIVAGEDVVNHVIPFNKKWAQIRQHLIPHSKIYRLVEEKSK